MNFSQLKHVTLKRDTNLNIYSYKLNALLNQAKHLKSFELFATHIHFLVPSLWKIIFNCKLLTNFTIRDIVSFVVTYIFFLH